MRIPACLTWIVALSSASIAYAQVAPLAGACTAATPPDIGGLEPGTPVDPGGRASTIVDNRVTLYLSAGPDDHLLAEASVYLDARSEIVLGSRAEPNRRLTVSRGSVVVHYLATDKQPVLVVAGTSYVRLESGTLWVVLRGENPEFSLVSQRGSATRFEGQPPAGDAGAVEGGQDLTPQLDQRKRAVTLINSLHASMGASAPAGWLYQAETDDLIPTNRGDDPELPYEVPSVERPVEPTGMTTSVATAAPATANVLPPISSVTVTPAPERLAGVQALLASGNPASVLVGTRLERARVVGVIAPTTGITFNRVVRPPLDLSPGR